MMNKAIREKYENLCAVICHYESALVAFSGGVDSTLLAYAAFETLGSENIVCVTARSALFPLRELRSASAFCETRFIRHEFIDFDEFQVDGFAQNPKNRCYLCKYALFSKFGSYAASVGMKAVFEGSNADDTASYRPGMKAVAELGIKSPLLEAGLTKADIRAICREFGLSVWDKQSFACLASRFPYGETITAERLSLVDRAEQFLLDYGFRFVRVRLYGKDRYTARIEVMSEDTPRLSAEPLRGEVTAYFETLGFTYVTLDLKGYRTGSMDEAL